MEYQALLATVYARFGDVEIKDRHYNAALEWYLKSKQELLAVVEMRPNDFNSAHEFGYVRLMISKLRPGSPEAEENARELREYLDRCIERFSEPEREAHFQGLIDAL